MHPDRWENGSDFHWIGLPSVPDAGRAHPVPWASGLLLSSGRDALRLVLSTGMRSRGWRRLWVPEYFCQQVTAALVRPGLELRLYADSPLYPAPPLPDASPGDAVLVVNYFGLRSATRVAPSDGVDIIEDHSHDPTSSWAGSSSADFCVASLRKTLPIPDGGVVWSPRGHRLPAAPRIVNQRKRATASKLAGMLLKAMYLDNHDIERATYRALLVEGEQALHVPAVSGIGDVSRALVSAWPLRAWREARRRNHALLATRLAGVEGLRVLMPDGEDTVPFSCVVLAESADRRERMRKWLIANRVFPAVLWPLDDTVLAVGVEARGISRRILSIHCDGRYDASDIGRVADLVSGVADR